MILDDLGAVLGILGQLRVILGQLEAVLKPSWGLSWGHLAPTLGLSWAYIWFIFASLVQCMADPTPLCATYMNYRKDMVSLSDIMVFQWYVA
jgi:hypothetical protein